MTEGHQNHGEAWHNRPATIYGAVFWNRKPIRGMLSHLPGPLVFHKAFEDAVRDAQKRRGSLIAWTSRLTPGQKEACKAVGVPLIFMEDGFIRSVGLGAALNPAASLVFDTRGIYYDASAPSDLEWMLEHCHVSKQEEVRGAALKALILERRVSKYNLGDQSKQNYFPTQKHKILVPGQVADDAAILKSRSDSLDWSGGKNPNLALLEWVRARNPGAYILYKPHPDIAKGLRKGGLASSDVARLADDEIIDADITTLLDQCDTLHTISSLSGFEALLRGKKVVVHGQPFYAGWGLTEDHTSFPRRSRQRSLEALVYLALVRYGRYSHPETFLPAEVEEVITALDDRRRSGKGMWSARLRLGLAWLFERLGM